MADGRLLKVHTVVCTKSLTTAPLLWQLHIQLTNANVHFQNILRRYCVRYPSYTMYKAFHTLMCSHKNRNSFAIGARRVHVTNKTCLLHVWTVFARSSKCICSVCEMCFMRVSLACETCLPYGKLHDCSACETRFTKDIVCLLCIVWTLKEWSHCKLDSNWFETGLAECTFHQHWSTFIELVVFTLQF